MEEIIQKDELEQMKEQMQLLQDKLDKQEIINEKLVRDTVRTKMNWIRNFVYFEFFLIPVLAVMLYFLMDLINLSWYYYIFTIAFCTLDVILDYRINVSSLKIRNAADYSISETVFRLADMKQKRAKALYIMLVPAVIFVVWTGVGFWKFLTGNINEPLALWTKFGIFIFGIILALAIVIYIYRKMQKTNDESMAIISTIEDLNR